MDDQTSGEFIRIQAALAGRYSLQRELGRGGMGIVYLAHEVALERPVSLKLLQPHLASQPALKQRFLNEARTAAKLSHPNIIPIFAVDEVDDFVFFVMAFVDGETLGQRIRSRGPLPASELAKILRDVGWALAYAHAQGVVHRDVKADNIMIERGSGRALVVDFGIARVTQNTGVTGAGEILGTADYMSPEQASGGVVDHRSDIYSLGVVAYYALSGRLPFEAPTVGAMLAKHITQPPPQIAEAVPGLPTKLGDAVDRCLVKDPAQRFASAEELADVVSVALASRREAPRPIQIFTKKASEISQNLLFIGYFQLFLVLIGALAAITREGLGGNVMFGLAAIGLATWPVLAVGMLGQIRTLLKSGYTRDDLVASWNRELQFDQDERALEHGRTAGLVERASRWAVPLGWGCIIAATALGGPFHDAALWLGGLGWTTAFLGGVLSLWRYDGRTALSRRLVGKFVNSRLGRWAFRMAGLGLDRSALASLATHRPTELAIGADFDLPDVPAHLVRLGNGSLLLVDGDAPVNYVSIGADFNSLRRNCTPALVAADRTAPEAYENQEWVSAPYRVGNVIHALVHNEYHDPIAPNCQPGNTTPANPCWYNSITYAASTNDGATFTKPSPPFHVVAPAPLRWDPTIPGANVEPQGYFEPSNIVQGSDGYYYSVFFVLSAPASPAQRGVCVMRTTTLGDPTSWRAWDGTGYNLRMESPYQTNAAVSACTLVSTSDARGSLTYNTYLKRYMLVGTTVRVVSGQPVCGFFYTLSSDLISWDPIAPLKEGFVPWSPCRPPDGTNAGIDFYPSIVDHDDQTINFERPGQTPYLYYTHFNSYPLDRDLVRRRMMIVAP